MTYACISVTLQPDHVKPALHLCKSQSDRQSKGAWLNLVKEVDLFCIVCTSGGDCTQEHTHDWAHRLWEDRDCEAPGQIS